MKKEISIDNLEQRLQFDIRLQIALRINAIRIMENSSTPDRFRQYIRDRESKLKILLNIDDMENVEVTYKGKRIFP